MVNFLFHHKLGHEKRGFSIEAEGILQCGLNILFGPSGSGKSTLIRLFAGLDKAKLKNQIKWDHQGLSPVKPFYQLLSMGYLPQGGGVYPNLGLLENILLGRKLNKDDQALLDLGLEELGLLNSVHKLGFSLSGGEKLRIGLLRSLLGKPDFLLLDEPFSGLDPFLKGKAKQFLTSQLKTWNPVTLLVTHDLEDAKLQDSNLLLIDKGKMVSDIRNAGDIQSYFESKSL